MFCTLGKGLETDLFLESVSSAPDRPGVIFLSNLLTHIFQEMHNRFTYGILLCFDGIQWKP